eukprot:3726055-Prymnesium_polylepis.1
MVFALLALPDGVIEHVLLSRNLLARDLARVAATCRSCHDVLVPGAVRSRAQELRQQQADATLQELLWLLHFHDLQRSRPRSTVSSALSKTIVIAPDGRALYTGWLGHGQQQTVPTP